MWKQTNINSLLLQRKHIELKDFFFFRCLLNYWWNLDQLLFVLHILDHSRLFVFFFKIYVFCISLLSLSLSSSRPLSPLSLSLNKAFLVCRKCTCPVKLKPVINGSLLCELMDCLTRRLNCLPSCLHLKRKFKQEEGLHGPDSRLLPHLYLQT